MIGYKSADLGFRENDTIRELESMKIFDAQPDHKLSKRPMANRFATSLVVGMLITLVPLADPLRHARASGDPQASANDQAASPAGSSVPLADSREQLKRLQEQVLELAATHSGSSGPGEPVSTE